MTQSQRLWQYELSGEVMVVYDSEATWRPLVHSGNCHE
uniref:Uncharacterized protein n=1 Tax=Arundo donax TaxID=35708 RepID=A0A0A9BMY2_ARUDO